MRSCWRMYKITIDTWRQTKCSRNEKLNMTTGWGSFGESYHCGLGRMW